MYWKLIVRGLQRHGGSGKRIFVLLALCSAAILFFLAFRDSFSSRYRQMVIDVSTSHLQIIPASSPKLSEDGNCTDHRQGLELLDYSPELEKYLSSLPGVSATMLSVETRASIFTLEGEPLGLSSPIIGVDTAAIDSTLPGVAVLMGSGGLAWKGEGSDIPVFRPLPQLSEAETGGDRFAARDLRLKGAAEEKFKAAILRDFPALFASAREPLSDAELVGSLNAALDRRDLASLARSKPGRAYDYRIDDALAALDAASSREGGVDHRKILRKRLLQALYPDAIAPVRDAVELGVPYTMTVPQVSGESERPLVLPVSIAAYVQRIPLYNGSYYIDAKALRARMGLGERQGTNIYVRLKGGADPDAAAASIRSWLASKGLDYVVRDYRELGRLYLATAVAFGAITLVLALLFVATAMIFIVNSVLLAVKKRRREIGTSIAIGFEPRSNILVLFGETIALVLVSWLAGSLIGAIVVMIFHGVGLPGIAFMPGGSLILDLAPSQLATSLVLVLVASGAAALMPLRRLAAAKPVELLKEAE